MPYDSTWRSPSPPRRYISSSDTRRYAAPSDPRRYAAPSDPRRYAAPSASRSNDTSRFPTYELDELDYADRVANLPTTSRPTPVLPPPRRTHRRGGSNELSPSVWAPEYRHEHRNLGEVVVRRGETTFRETDAQRIHSAAKRSLADLEAKLPRSMGKAERAYYFNWFMTWHTENPQSRSVPKPPYYVAPLAPKPASTVGDVAVSVGVGALGVLTAAVSSQVASSDARAGLIGAGVTATALGVGNATRMYQRGKNERDAYKTYREAQRREAEGGV